MKKKALQNPRIAAIQAIQGVLDDHRSLADCPVLDGIGDPRDSALARHLSYGVLRWLSALEWLARRMLSRPLKSRDSDIQILVLLGLQQLWHDRTASHAAVNETAECARLLGKAWAVGLVNAVLRRFQREQETLLQRLSETEALYAHPMWLLKEIREDWPVNWKEILSANNQQAPLWLRINRARADVEALKKQLAEAGFKHAAHPYAADAISISPAAPVIRIPGFEKGWLSVQDPAAQLARDLLNPQKGERVLDACAAPGGKTAHLLETCADIKLTVLDLQQSRIDQIDQNLDRLGLTASVQCADASKPESWWDGKKFHKILLDAPCSATGVIRRHPEIKWLRSPEQVDAVVKTQWQLLQALWPLLEDGGLLVYATCSVLKRENDAQVGRFLQQNDNAELLFPDVGWGDKLTNGMQILPAESQMDGFFYAVLQKKT